MTGLRLTGIKVGLYLTLCTYLEVMDTLNRLKARGMRLAGTGRADRDALCAA